MGERNSKKVIAYIVLPNVQPISHRLTTWCGSLTGSMYFPWYLTRDFCFQHRLNCISNQEFFYNNANRRENDVYKCYI